MPKVKAKTKTKRKKGKPPKAELDRKKREKKGELTIKELQLKAYGLNPSVLQILLQGLENDFSILEACQAAGIAEQTYYNWKKKSKEFGVKMNIARGALFRAAKSNISRAIQKSKSVHDSWKLLEKRQKETYSDRFEHTGADGEELITSVTVKVINKHRTFDDDESEESKEE